MPNPARDYLALLLDQYWFAPPVALWRAVELRTAAAESFPRPILDLGCGDGLIARILFEGEAPVDVGLDPWFSQIRRAPSTGAYTAVQQASADAMPYRSGVFGTVFSNSVLEHIPNLTPVVQEVARVLVPGGRFIATVPSDAFRRLLAGYRAAIEAGNPAGAESYALRVDRELQHHRYPTPQAWEAMLAPAGLRLLRAQYYIPAAVEHVWDRANFTYGIRQEGSPLYRWLASPRLRKLGYQTLIRRWVVRSLSKRWRKLYTLDVPAGDAGGGLLIVAERIA